MKKGIKLEIINEGDAPVYMKYDGQYLPQPAFLRLNLTGKEPRFYADYSGEIGSSTPMNVYNNLTVEWSIEANTSRQSLLDINKNEELQSLLIQIVEGHEIEGQKGYFNDDAALAIEELETVLENELECIDVWAAKDYIESCSYSLKDIPAGGIEELAKDTELYADAAIFGDIKKALEEYFKELIEREEEEEDEE